MSWMSNNVGQIAQTIPPCEKCDHVSCEMQRASNSANRDTVREIEKEKIKRLMHSLIDRIDKL